MKFPTNFFIVLNIFVTGSFGKVRKSNTLKYFQANLHFIEFQYKKLHYFNISHTGNDQFLNISSLEMACDVNTRENPCGLSPKISLSLLIDLPRPYLHLKIFEVETKKLHLKRQISFCSISQNPGLNIFIRLFFEQLKQVTNFKFEYPMKKVECFLKNNFLFRWFLNIWREAMKSRSFHYLQRPIFFSTFFRSTKCMASMFWSKTRSGRSWKLFIIMHQVLKS